MKQFLFPTNFTDESKASLRYAQSFANEYDANLVLFNSYYSTESPKRNFLSEGTRFDETIRQLKKFSSEEVEKGRSRDNSCKQE